MPNRYSRFLLDRICLPRLWSSKVFFVFLVMACVILGSYAQGAEVGQLKPESGLPDVNVKIEQHELNLLQSRRFLRLGIAGGGYEPLSVVNGASVKGIMVDYLAIIGKSLGLSLEARIYPDWPSAIAALRAGEVDVLGLGSSYEAQFKDLLLSQRYTAIQPVLVGRGGDLADEQTLSQVKLAVVGGFAALDELRTRFPNAQINTYTSVREALHAVEYRHDRWLVGDALTAAYHMSFGELPSLRMRTINDWKIPGYSFVMRADDASIVGLINKVLERVPQVTQANIIGYWGGEPRFDSTESPIYTPEALEWLATRPEIRVLVTGEAPPYSFYDNEGNFRGLNADILEEISRRSGLRFKMIEVSSYSNVLEILRNQEAEMSTLLLPTPERKKFLNFTESFVSSSFALVGRSGSNINSLDELQGRRVSISEGAAAGEVGVFLRSHYPRIELVDAAGHLSSLVAIAQGEVDGAILSLPIARHLINQYFSKDLRVITSLPRLQQHLGFAVIKDQQLLFDVLEATLNNIEPGEISHLIERWQNIMPAEGNVWAGYTDRIRWLAVAGGTALLLLLFWQAYAYFRRAKERAEESLLAFRSVLLDGIPQAVVMLDLQGRFVLCNHAFYSVFGLQPESVIGHSWAEIEDVGAGQESARALAYEELLERNESISMQEVELSMRGEPFIFRQWAVLHTGSDGQIAGVLMGWIDLSTTARLLLQLEIMRNKAVEASAAKSNFLAVMSHEIRTPLNAIIGLLELTMKRVDNGEDWDRSAIEVAYSSSHSLMALIGDILDLSKIESGKFELEPQRDNPQEILESVQRVFHGLARQKGLHLQTNIRLDSTREVMVDGGRLKQVLSNLLSNAIKFTDHGEVKLSLWARDEDDDLLMDFIVEDCGIGISAADQTLLFEPFSQAGGQSSWRGGTGLGLVICKQLIELMGGACNCTARWGMAPGSRLS
ncbi:transporter substrate-binding domain-containing protein [Pseudomonas peli]|uniref:transporter substrate-binding domain-containing protein n=1 Tax=Pseudomonas peli TaxID=592361 RepID=UPI0024AE1ED7|nr:transporter substrate-binding domain-containing protein [Pseudomonas peli]